VSWQLHAVPGSTESNVTANWASTRVPVGKLPPQDEPPRAAKWWADLLDSFWGGARVGTGPRGPQPRLWALPLALGLLLVDAAWAADLVANGDFEKLSPDGTAPLDWAYIASDGGEGSLSMGEGLEGGHCAQITYTQPGRRWGPGVGQVTVVQVRASQWYELSFWARQEGLSTGVIVGLRDMTNWDDNQIWQWVFPSSQWRRFRLPFQAHRDLSPQVSRLQFSFDSLGTVWIDRVSLIETEPPPFPNLVDLGEVKNRVPNSSFEVGSFGWGTYGSTFLVGEIDETTAHHGRRSFRLDLCPRKLPVEWNDFTYVQRGKPTHLPQAGLSLASVGYLPVTPGRPMCLSAYLKLDRPAEVRLGLIEETGAEQADLVDIGTDWARCAVSVTPQSEHAFVRFAVEPGETHPRPTILWVDAVQLETGDKPTDYAPALPVELGFDTGREGNLYHVGEPAEAKMLLYNAQEKDEQVTVHLSVEGFFHETVRETDLTVRAPVGKSVWCMIDLPNLAGKGRNPNTESGFYRLHALWDSPAGPQHRQFRFGVIHPLRDAYRGQDTFLGQNHAFTDAGLMRLTRDAGTSWVRSWFVRWDDIEPKPGEFHFEEADAQLAWLKKLDFNVEFCLGDPSSEWVSTAPADLKDTTGAEAESQRVWWLPRDLQAYEDYVAALMARYGDQVKHWEVFNEPVNGKGGPNGNLGFDRNYLLFLQAARRAAQRTHKDAEILGAGLGYLAGMRDISPILSAIDILSEHRYPGLQPTSDFGAGIRSAADRMRVLGRPKPIWITEYGLYADDDPDPTTAQSSFLIHQGEDSELLAATYAIEHEVMALANGADHFFFHVGNWPIILNREHGCGFHPFFEWNGLPRKMLVAQNTLSWALPPGSRFVRAISATPPLMAYEFATPKGTTIVTWATPPVALSAEARRALEGEGVEVYDVVGRRVREVKEVAEWPVYVVVGEPKAAQRAGKALQDAALRPG